MNDLSVSPAPLVEQALQSLRGTATDRIPAPGATGAESPAAAAPPETAPARPAREPGKKRERAHVAPQPALSALDAEQIADAAASLKPRGGASASLDSALGALRSVSVAAQARLTDPEDFPELPTGRDLSSLGPYVEHVMREAQGAAVAYREESARETTARAAKLLGEATASADKIRQDADAYGERTVAQADALLAERLHRIAELTRRLSQMAQTAGDEFAQDRTMRDQMTQFISGLTAAAEETVAQVFPVATHDALS